MQNEAGHSAIVIPFPKRGRRAAALAATQRVAEAARPKLPPVARVAPAPQIANPGAVAAQPGVAPLTRVMAELDNALTHQNAAVARWRTAIQELRVAMDGLDNSLKQYRDRLAPSGKGLSGQR